MNRVQICYCSVPQTILLSFLQGGASDSLFVRRDTYFYYLFLLLLNLTCKVKIQLLLTQPSSNRYSMPVTSSRTRNNQAKNDYASTMGLGHINTTGFLFGDDDDKSNGNKESATSPDVKNYLHMNATDDRFPILVRRNEQPGVVRILIRKSQGKSQC